MNPGAPRVPTARPTGFHKPVDVDGAASVERQEAWGPCGLWHCSEFPGLGSSHGGLLRVLSGQHPGPEASTPVLRPSLALSGPERQTPLVQGSVGPASPRLWVLSCGRALRFWRWLQGVCRFPRTSRGGGAGTGRSHTAWSPELQCHLPEPLPALSRREA